MKPWAASAATTISELAVHKSAAHCRRARSLLASARYFVIRCHSSTFGRWFFIYTPLFPSLPLRPIRRDNCKNVPVWMFTDFFPNLSSAILFFESLTAYYLEFRSNLQYNFYIYII